MKKSPSVLCLRMLMAAASLAGCASSDRMMRVSPMSEPAARAGSEVAPTLRDDRVNSFPLYYENGPMHSVLWPFIDWDDRGFAFRPFYNREGTSASVLFPLSGWDEKGGWALNTFWGEKGWMALPLAGGYAGTNFVGPAFWCDDGARGLFPLWYESKDAFWFAELYASNRDEAGARRRRSLLGIPYASVEEANGDGFTWVFPLGAWGGRGEGSWICTAPFSRFEDDLGARLNVHPLWWSGKYKDGSSYDALLPLWYRSSGEGRSTLITPLFARGRDDAGSWTGVPPFWWSSQDKTGGLSVLFPLWFNGHDADGDRTVSPLFSHGRDRDGSWLNVHPLWWSSETADGSAGSSLLAPLGYRSWGGDRESTVSPLFSYGRDRDGSWLNVHPLWWSFTKRDGASRSGLVPLWFRDSDLKGTRTVSWFYTAGHDSRGDWFNLHPLWWSGKTSDGDAYSSLVPLWYESTAGESRSVFTPVFSRGRNEGGSWLNIHPLWWSGITRDGESYASLIPFWYTSAGEHRRRLITPLVSRGEKDGDSWFNVHPLWWSLERKDGSSRSALIPLWCRTTDAEGGASTVSPFFSAGHDRGGSWLNIHPLWWSSGDKSGAGRSMLLPLWYTASDSGGGSSTLSPLFSLGRDATGSWLNLHPLWWSGEYGDGSAYSALLPLWWRIRGPDGEGMTLSPLYSEGADASGYSRFNIHPLWWSGGDAKSGYSLMLPLWLRLHDPSGTSLFSPLGAWFTDAKGDTAGLNVLGSVYHRERASDGEYSHALWPLWSGWTGAPGTRPMLASFAARTDAGEASAFRITPLVSREFGGGHETWREWAHLVSLHATDAGGGGFSVTPLVVRREGPGESVTRVVPFYESERGPGGADRLSLRPFYVSDPDPGILDHLTHLWVRTESARREGDRFLLCFGTRVSRENRADTGRVETREKFGPGYSSTVVTNREPLAAPESRDLLALESWEWTGSLFSEPPAADVAGARSPRLALTGAEADKAVRKILERLGQPADDASPGALRAAVARALDSRARKVARRTFTVDPLWIPLFKNESDGKGFSWKLLFGLARGESDGARSSASVLRYLYNRESGPDGSRMNCFPFVSRDDTTKRSSVAFLWRVFHHETDKATGKSSGHILFIPY